MKSVMSIRTLVLGAACMALVPVASSHASVIASDSFNYATGSLADGTATTGTGFSGNWSVKDPGNNAAGGATIVSGLTYPADGATNNALQGNPGTAIRALDPLASSISTSGTAWISFLIKNGGDSGGVPVGMILNGDQTNSLFAGFNGGYSANDTNFGLGTMTSGTTAAGAVFAPLTYASGGNVAIDNTTTHLIVLELAFTSGTTANVSEFIDPVAGQATPPGTASAVVNGLNVGNISALGMDRAGGPGLTMDEFRVGTSYADVVAGTSVPEPASLSLLALGGLGLMGRRRRV